MKTLPEKYNRVERWPFADYTHVGDLIEFEGPILVHYQKGQKHAFYYWVEGNSSVNTWMCFEVTLVQLYDYLYRNLSLYELIDIKKNEPFYLVDIDANLSYNNFRILTGQDIPEDYLPDEDSYYVEEVVPAYEKLFLPLKEVLHHRHKRLLKRNL